MKCTIIMALALVTLLIFLPAFGHARSGMGSYGGANRGFDLGNPPIRGGGYQSPGGAHRPPGGYLEGYPTPRGGSPGRGYYPYRSRPYYRGWYPYWWGYPYRWRYPYSWGWYPYYWGYDYWGYGFWFSPWYFPSWYVSIGPPVYYTPPPVVYPVPDSPAYAYPDPEFIEKYGKSDSTKTGGEWVTVPGQWVDGVWVDEHQAWAPSGQ